MDYINSTGPSSISGTSSIYGTLPRTKKRDKSKREKRTPEDMAAHIANYVVYKAEPSDALPMLTCCRIYTQPILVLKNLRKIWEQEVQDEETFEELGTGSPDDSPKKSNCNVPFEFLTLRRRPNRRSQTNRSASIRRNSNNSMRLNSTGSSLRGRHSSSDWEDQAFGSILADLKMATEKLATQTETQKEPDFNIFNSISLEQSRDSGFGSFSNSIISETSCDHELTNEMGPDQNNSSGYFPVTMTPLQRKISNLIESWINQSPSTFGDSVANKILESFTRIITIHNSQASNWMTQLNTKLVNAAQFRQSIRRNKLKYTSSNNSLYQISSNCLEMIRHLTWIELNLAKNLTQDEIINQLMNENQSDQEYPNWRLNCNFFNVLSASTQFTVLSCSKNSECAKAVNYLIDVAIGLCQVGNFNSAMAIALGLDSKPVSRLHKVWKKIDNAKINILKNIANPSNNFLNYREIFRLSKSKMPISIPYLSLLSKDIYLKLQKDENDKIENVLERSILLTKLWRQIKSVEKIESNDLNPLILKKIYGLSAKCDDELYYMSYKLEPPQSTYEKDEYKKLKTLRKASKMI